jgi:hypothetical protein
LPQYLNRRVAVHQLAAFGLGAAFLDISRIISKAW